MDSWSAQSGGGSRRSNSDPCRDAIVAALVAILTCPCHVGVAIILLSGTAVGGWLAAQRAWLYVLFTFLFVGGLLLLFRRDPADCDRCGD